MWSKQADARKNHVGNNNNSGNTNMTSLKNKITNRKRKTNAKAATSGVVAASSSSSTSGSNGAIVVSETIANGNKKSSKKNKNNKKSNKKESAAVNKEGTLLSDGDGRQIRSPDGQTKSSTDGNPFAETKPSAATETDQSAEGNSSPEQIGDDVVDNCKIPLTHALAYNELPTFANRRSTDCCALISDSMSNSSSRKRYSDSFVLDNNNVSFSKQNNCDENVQTLTRAQSGFIVPTTQKNCECRANRTDEQLSPLVVTTTETATVNEQQQQQRKTRRFSDIFRTSTLTANNSKQSAKNYNSKAGSKGKSDIASGGGDVPVKMQPKMLQKQNSNVSTSSSSSLQIDHSDDVVLRKKKNKNRSNSSDEGNKCDNNASDNNNKSAAAKCDAKSKKKKEKLDHVESMSSATCKAGNKVENSSSSSSYLKRVKSKIYSKHKNENNNNNKLNNKNSVSVQPSMPNISESGEKRKSGKKSALINGGEEEVNNQRKKPDVVHFKPQEIRKSLTYLDFRLLRQSSNLERGRSKSYMQPPPQQQQENPHRHAHPLNRSSCAVDRADSATNVNAPQSASSSWRSICNNNSSDNSAIVGGGNSNKPFLAKSKSSSSINLNLLRTRRNRFLDLLSVDRRNWKNSQMVEDEFEFIAFGDVPNYPLSEFGSLRSLNNHFGNNNNNQQQQHHVDKWIYEEDEGDTGKPGQPVTRSGSDRHPGGANNGGGGDGTKEETRSQDHHNTSNVSNDDDASQCESSVSLPASTSHKKKSSSNIIRSESVKEQNEKRKQRRNISDPLHNTKTTSEPVDLENISHRSGSSSSSSICSRSSDPPSTSFDGTQHTHQHHHGSDDSDLDVEADPPDWQSHLTEEELSRLEPLERKRQDVINELFHTERSHVRNLKVLNIIFWKKLSTHKVLKNEEMTLIFPNLAELLQIHTAFNTSMKQKRKEETVVRNIGDLLLRMFDGPMGQSFEKAAATFCERQQSALQFIKDKRKKDQRFEQVLRACETDNLCRRLPLQGFIPSEMQRLSKYPLLFERLIDIVQKLCGIDPEAEPELRKLRAAYQRSKEILKYVNDAAKEYQSTARLEEIQTHLENNLGEKVDKDLIEFKNLDMTKYKLLHEGAASLIRNNKTNLPVHLVLVEGVLFLFHKEGDKYVLKNLQSATSDCATPVIKLAHLIVRANAADKNSLILINTTITQMYNLRGRDPTETKRWIKYLQDAAESYNKRDGRLKRVEHAPDEEETVQELPPSRDPTERAETVGETAAATATDSSTTTIGDSERNGDTLSDDDKDKRLSSDVEQHCNSSSSSSSNAEGTGSVGGGGVTMKLTAEEWPLIQPSEMQTIVPPVHTAESIVTLIEQIKQKDEEVRKALADKEMLVADMLNIPREDFHHIADMISEDTLAATTTASSTATSSASSTYKEPCEIVLAAVYQTDKLLQAINDAQNVTEADVVASKGGKYPSCASNETTVAKKLVNGAPQVPVVKIERIATTLNSQLTGLLSTLKEREDERERLRKELQRTREHLHEVLALHRPQCTNHADDDDVDEVNRHDDNDEETYSDCQQQQSGDLESIKESPTEHEN